MTAESAQMMPMTSFQLAGSSRKTQAAMATRTMLRRKIVELTPALWKPMDSISRMFDDNDRVPEIHPQRMVVERSSIGLWNASRARNQMMPTTETNRPQDLRLSAKILKMKSLTAEQARQQRA